MADALRSRMFEEGDWVLVVGPLAETYRGETGIVRSITLAGAVYRYVVEFDEGRSDDSWRSLRLSSEDIDD